MTNCVIDQLINEQTQQKIQTLNIDSKQGLSNSFLFIFIFLFPFPPPLPHHPPNTPTLSSISPACILPCPLSRSQYLIDQSAHNEHNKLSLFLLTRNPTILPKCLVSFLVWSLGLKLLSIFTLPWGPQPQISYWVDGRQQMSDSWSVVGIVRSIRCYLVSYITICLSFLPPPLTRMLERHGHHVKALTAPLWWVNVETRLLFLMSHRAIVPSFDPLAKRFSFRLKPQIQDFWDLNTDTTGFLSRRSLRLMEQSLLPLQKRKGQLLESSNLPTLSACFFQNLMGLSLTTSLTSITPSQSPATSTSSPLANLTQLTRASFFLSLNCTTMLSVSLNMQRSSLSATATKSAVEMSMVLQQKLSMTPGTSMILQEVRGWEGLSVGVVEVLVREVGIVVRNSRAVYDGTPGSLENVSCFFFVVDFVVGFCYPLLGDGTIGDSKEFFGAETLRNGMNRSECKCLAEFFIFSFIKIRQIDMHQPRFPEVNL